MFHECNKNYFLLIFIISSNRIQFNRKIIKGMKRKELPKELSNQFYQTYQRVERFKWWEYRKVETFPDRKPFLFGILGPFTQGPKLKIKCPALPLGKYTSDSALCLKYVNINLWECALVFCLKFDLELWDVGWTEVKTVTSVTASCATQNKCPL